MNRNLKTLASLGESGSELTGLFTYYLLTIVFTKTLRWFRVSNQPSESSQFVQSIEKNRRDWRRNHYRQLKATYLVSSLPCLWIVRLHASWNNGICRQVVMIIESNHKGKGSKRLRISQSEFQKGSATL